MSKDEGTVTIMVNSRTFDLATAAAAISRIAPEGGIEVELERMGLSADATDDPVAKAAILFAGVRSQGDFAVRALNVTNGEIDPDGLTRLLAVAFPGARIGGRHGPHYMSLARGGKIDGVRKGLVIPHRTKRTKPSPSSEGPELTAEAVEAGASKPELMTSETEAETEKEEVTAESLLASRSRRELQIEAKELGVSAGGKTPAIAERIAEYHRAKAAA